MSVIQHKRFFLVGFLFSCILLNVALSALPDSNAIQMQKAENYLETEQFPQALKIYQNLLQESPLSWQRGILMYNIGTVFLEEGEYNQAEQIFNAISYDYVLAPLVKYKVLYNLITLHAKQGSALKESDPQAAFKKLESAQKEAILLDQFYCALHSALGDETCEEPQLLIFLKSDLQQQMASIKVEIGKQRINSANFTDSIKYLMQSIEQMIGYINFLNPIQPGTLQNKYKSLFLNQLNALKPLWEHLASKLSTSSSKDEAQKKRLQLFQDAETFFEEGKSQLSDQHFEESTNAFTKAIEILKKLLLIPPSSPSESPKPPSTRSPEEEKPDKQEIESENNEQQLLQIYQDDQLPIPKMQGSDKKELRPW